MNFARAKTILIFIFLFVNIFLIVVYNLFFQKVNTVDIDVAIDILKNNNITVEKSLVKHFESSMQGAEVYNVSTDKEKTATMFLGENYTSPRENYYTKEGESLLISDTSVDYKVFDAKDKSFNKITHLNAGNKTLKALNKKGIGKSVLQVLNITDNGEKNFFVTFMYAYNDYPVFNSNLYATVTDKGITSIKGTVLSFEKIKEKYNLTPPSNILLELVSNNELKSEFQSVQITGLRLGYYLPLGKSETSTYAIPSYEIEVNDCKVFYYDARENITPDVVLLGSKNISK